MLATLDATIAADRQRTAEGLGEARRLVSLEEEARVEAVESAEAAAKAARGALEQVGD